MLLSAVRTILTVLRLAADELLEEHVALVMQLVVNADLRRVVPANRRLLRHHEERFERCLRRLLVAADGLQNGVDLRGREFGERRAEPRRGFAVERREPAEPFQ